MSKKSDNHLKLALSLLPNRKNCIISPAVQCERETRKNDPVAKVLLWWSKKLAQPFVTTSINPSSKLTRFHCMKHEPILRCSLFISLMNNKSNKSRLFPGAKLERLLCRQLHLNSQMIVVAATLMTNELISTTPKRGWSRSAKKPTFL